MSPTTEATPGRPFYTVRASFLSALLTRFEATDRGATRLLDRTGISMAQLADPYGTIPMAQFVGFLEAAAQVTGDPGFGARMGTEIKAGDMGPVGLVLSLSESVAAGMARLVRYTNALQGGTDTQWIRFDDTWIFSYRLTDPTLWPRRQDAEFSLSSVVQVIRDNFRSRWTPQEVHFEHAAPEDPQPMERLFRCPVRYGQPINRLIADTAFCAQIVRKEDQDLLATLQRHIQDIIGTTVAAPDIVTAARAVIEAHLGLTPITLDHVADALSLTPRTLQRRLADHGIPLRALLEDVRRTRATVLLAQPRAKVAEVSEALGYSDPTAFWRAWRGWTGTTPSQAKSGAPQP